MCDDRLQWPFVAVIFIVHLRSTMACCYGHLHSAIAVCRGHLELPCLIVCKWRASWSSALYNSCLPWQPGMSSPYRNCCLQILSGVAVSGNCNGHVSWSSALNSSFLAWPTCNSHWQSLAICSSHLQWPLHLPSAMALCCHCFPSANDHYNSLCSDHLHSLSAASICKDHVHMLPPLSISNDRLKLCNHHRAHST